MTRAVCVLLVFPLAAGPCGPVGPGDDATATTGEPIGSTGPAAGPCEACEAVTDATPCPVGHECVYGRCARLCSLQVWDTGGLCMVGDPGCPNTCPAGTCMDAGLWADDLGVCAAAGDVRELICV